MACSGSLPPIDQPAQRCSEGRRSQLKRVQTKVPEEQLDLSRICAGLSAQLPIALALKPKSGPRIATPIALYGLKGLYRCCEKLPDHPERGTFACGAPVKAIWIHGPETGICGFPIKVLDLGLTQNAFAHCPARHQSS